MGTSPELLVKYGFAEKDKKTGKIKGEEEIEGGMDFKGNTIYIKTGFPEPKLNYRVVHQVFNQSIEENYFWTVEFLRTHEAYHDILKITDMFSASEHSAFFGSAQQRLGLQQDKVSQFLATIGKMVKELFQLVREIRILDERLGYYEDSMDAKSKTRESAEITLKGIWIDLVEQGSKNPASVYGMARELQFTTLPDLFFSVHPMKIDEVDAMVAKLDFNRKVKEVLSRKIRTYLQWKITTHDEIKNRRIFTIKYLRQHFDIIRMYMHWVKPYLRNIRRLQLMNQTNSPDLISAFEGSLVEIEILAKKLPTNFRYGRQLLTNEKYSAVIILHFSYRSTPQMAYNQEYNRGPLHVGKTALTLRAYAWDDKKIKKYMDMKQEEDLELLSIVDGSVKAALEALGDELQRYLNEAGSQETFAAGPEKKGEAHGEKDGHAKGQEKPSGLAEPFIAVAKGFGEVLKPLSFGIGSKEKGHVHHMSEQVEDNEKETAGKVASDGCYQVYKEFKKKNGMVHW
ncbi:hypothetical protein HZA99_02640 [Candidatus Woesearchaeota archaeon]|nr:hypothetical protein [Candidatus Woesearchaeota archaeon]